jgi:alpha-2-macroglobulin
MSKSTTFLPIPLLFLIACLQPLPAAPAGPVPVEAAAKRAQEAVPERSPAVVQDPQAAELFRRARELSGQKSFALAHELYAKVDPSKLAPQEQRWLAFHLADTQWRSESASNQPDDTLRVAAREALEHLVRDVQREEDRDRLWIEVQESLGDFHWRRDFRDWSAAWSHYGPALEAWARSSELELARARYLALVWRITEPQDSSGWGGWQPQPPLEILEGAAQLARTPEERGRAHFLLARWLQQQGGDWRQQARIPRELEAALEGGRAQAWYDDALFIQAQWLEGTGPMVLAEDGSLRPSPDYVRALELYRRLCEELPKGESAYFDRAQERIRDLTQPTVGLAVSNFFLPGSKAVAQLSWRNVEHIELALVPVDLLERVRLSGAERGSGEWLSTIDLSTLERLRSWSEATGDKGLHAPGSKALVLEPDLPPGAYVLEARAGGAQSRELVLVTDAALVLKTSGEQGVAWLTRALDGHPIAEAAVRVFERAREGDRDVWHDFQLVTDADGLARFPLRGNERARELFVAARSGSSQAFAVGYHYGGSYDHQGWRVYAITDRPAYRPDETVHWKIVAREGASGAWRVPKESKLAYEIRDPRGEKVAEGVFTLNAFGSAWGEFATAAKHALGEYQLQLFDGGKRNVFFGATLFRLEEYKLPEFQVRVRTSETSGPGEPQAPSRAYKSGESVPVSIHAELYSGGAVAGAEVEAFVYRQSFWPQWHAPREFPWFYEESTSDWRWRSGRELVQHVTLTTDAGGEARLTIPTDLDAGDFEYQVEARVRDASRREVLGTGHVRVAQRRYTAFLTPRRNLYRPQDEVEVDVRTQDANENAFVAEGLVKVTRWRSVEFWLDSAGRPVSASELERARREASFPPAGWRREHRTEETAEIVSRLLKTDAQGQGVFRFVPERTGAYRVLWSSRDEDGALITAQTTLYVADDAATELEIRPGGLQIVLDRDTCRAGETAMVLLMAPSSDRYALFSAEGGSLFEARVVHLTGSVKLLELPLDERHIPNVFLSALMVSDAQLFSDVEEIVVPPVRQFLTVELAPGQREVTPRAEDTWTLTTRDASGKPVAAEVSLALVDESVYAIQGDYAGDPRQFFYGEKRQRRVFEQSTFQIRSYAKYARAEDGGLFDERRAAGGDWDQSRSDARGRELYDREEAYAEGDFALGSGVARKVRGGLDALSAAKERPAALGKKLGEASDEFKSEPAGGAGQPPGELLVRSDFRATAFWQPDIVTGADGTARVRTKYPDSLTSWKAVARAADATSRFGSAESTTRTRLPLMVRLQAPRFFVVGDVVTLSTLLRNNSERELVVEHALTADSERLPFADVDGNPRPSSVRIAPGAEVRVDQRVRATAAGSVTVRAVARSGELSDAMERTYRVYEHGIEKFLATSAKLDGEGLALSLDLPQARRDTRMRVQLAPSLAVSLLDALPYLIDYPYGCTEQTMSRFLPAAIVSRTLAKLGLEPGDIAGRMFGGIEAASADKTHPRKKHSLAELDAIAKASLERLADFQHADGGWGWWKGGESDPFMSAYVLWGLSLAKEAGVEVRSDVAERGAKFLALELVEAERQLDLQAWMLHGLSAYLAAWDQPLTEPHALRAAENLWNGRDGLNAYTRALFALAEHSLGQRDRARTLLDNLRNGVRIDEHPELSAVGGAGRSNPAAQRTAHWGNDGVWWRWSDGGVESTAMALRAFVAIDPKNELVPAIAHWLIRNRRGAQWSNTRDSAISVLALNDYLRQSGELASDLAYEVLVNGKPIASGAIAPKDVLSAPASFAVDSELLRDGPNEIRVRRTRGSGPLYVAVEAEFFSLEEPVRPAGNELFVRRECNRIVAEQTLLRGTVFGKRPWREGDEVPSGERVEVVLTVEAKNDLEYVVLEDLKPAGLEATSVKSGEPAYLRELKSGALERSLANAGRLDESSDFTGRTRWVHQELRDRHVALFVDKLPQGVWQIRYELRAEVPGDFHALPVLGHAMYVPEIRANGAETSFLVRDAD